MTPDSSNPLQPTDKLDAELADLENWTAESMRNFLSTDPSELTFSTPDMATDYIMRRFLAWLVAHYKTEKAELEAELRALYGLPLPSPPSKTRLNNKGEEVANSFGAERAEEYIEGYIKGGAAHHYKVKATVQSRINELHERLAQLAKPAPTNKESE